MRGSHNPPGFGILKWLISGGFGESNEGFGKHVFSVPLHIEVEMSKPRKVALYARVSTDGQSVTNQLTVLREIAERHGWKVVGEYTDKGISGAKGRDQRPGFDALCKAITRRECNMVAAWSIDRLGRSLSGLIKFLEEMDAKHVDLYLDQQSIDTTTPMGRMIFQITGAFAEFERTLIRERVKAGLVRARSNGKQLGRPRIPPEREEVIRKARAAGCGIKKIARETGHGVKTVIRVLEEDAAREAGG
jgi:DNA invertase Pin-like site-specific DNA recombinase